MGQIALFFAVLCSALLCAETQFNIGVRKVQYRKLAMCPKYRNFTLVLQQVRFKRDEHGTVTAISFQMKVTRLINKLAIVVSFKKCDDSGNLDSCEYFLKDYNASNICELMGKRGQVWSVFSDNFTLKKCPIQVGTYYARDVPISKNQVNLLPIPNADWIINLKGYDETGLYISCIDVEFLIYIGRTRPSI